MTIKMKTQTSFSENGDDIEDSSDPSVTTDPNASSTLDEARDEVKEIRDLAKKDTKRVRMWRLVVTVALLVTSCAVTLTTFRLLRKEEEDKFKTAFDQFSKTVLDAAVVQHQNRLESYSSLADIMSSVAYMNNETWPMFTFPRFEHFGYNAIKQSKTEIVNIVHKVTREKEEDWIDYANNNYEKWLSEGYEIESKRGGSVYENADFGNYHPFITETKMEGDFVLREDQEVYWASWVYSPPPVTDGFINWDFGSNESYKKIIQSASYLKNETLFTAVKKYVSAGIAFTKEEHDAMHSSKLEAVKDELPHAFLFHPIHANPNDIDSEVVAVICSGIAWDNSLLNLLPEEIQGLYVVIDNTCSQTYTFMLNGPDAIFLGEGDFHDPSFDGMHKTVVFRPEQTHPEYDTVGGHCVYSMHIYPSTEFEEIWDDNSSVIFAIVVATSFLVILAIFGIYDLSHFRRNEVLVERAARTTAIVSSLFPGQFRDDMIEHQKLTTDKEKKANTFLATKGNGFFAADSHLGTEGEEKDCPSMAKCYTDVTVMFADIVGFTAWSSDKEPTQVFELLGALYNSFDDIATSRRVFKVETVGDCYVAAAGIPNPQPHHAVAMARFARNIRSSMQILKRELAVNLGKDTDALDLRIGIHSGSVTAGVIRGQKARFQLFGDTMNTTARIETTGQAGRIHLSSATAALLEASGKAHWIVENNDCVIAKGKGELKTYWLVSDRSLNSTSASSHSDKSSMMDPEELCPTTESRKSSPLNFSAEHVKWSVEVLTHLLKKIENGRGETQSKHMVLAERARIHQMERAFVAADSVDEFKDILQIPTAPPRGGQQSNREGTEIPQKVVEQLHLYITCIANMHREDDRFHTFDHAVRVAHSVRTLMSRWKEPWTPFGCVWAALVHHVDHPGHGAFNETSLAAAYGHRAVAEQNALQLSWKLLLDDKFSDLRKIIYRTSTELEYFRQVTVNAVLATDLFDAELQHSREVRWQKASVADTTETEQLTNLQATAIIEVVIQASNVVHAMQHWETYRHWNDRLFEECYLAFKNGRIRTDPSENWYLTEVEFFDKHVIPLSKKLETSLKFLGKAKIGEDCLFSSLKNREQWRDNGRSIVAELVQHFGGSSST